jgi:hypothetical protein
MQPPQWDPNIHYQEAQQLVADAGVFFDGPESNPSTNSPFWDNFFIELTTFGGSCALAYQTILGNGWAPHYNPVYLNNLLNAAFRLTQLANQIEPLPSQSALTENGLWNVAGWANALRDPFNLGLAAINNPFAPGDTKVKGMGLPDTGLTSRADELT